MKKKLLIFSPSWIGDCVMTQPLLRQLHINNPGLILDVFAPKWSMAVYECMPEVNEIIENPFGHGSLDLKKRWQCGKELGKRGYDQIIVLPGSLKSGIIARATGIKQRTGYVGESRYLLLNDIRKLDKAKLPLMVDRYTALAYSKDHNHNIKTSYPKFSIDKNRQAITLQKYQLSENNKILALCPGAEFGPAKRWPSNHFAKLAQYYYQHGWQVWLFGSQKDDELAQEINHLSGERCINLCGKTNLSEAIDLLALAGVVVCNDSGLMHLAAAVGCRVMAIYGSSSPKHTPPLSDTAQILSLNLDCSPCFQRQCPLGHTHCLTEISPQFVIDAIGQ